MLPCPPVRALTLFLTLLASFHLATPARAQNPNAQGPSARPAFTRLLPPERDSSEIFGLHPRVHGDWLAAGSARLGDSLTGVLHVYDFGVHFDLDAATLAAYSGMNSVVLYKRVGTEWTRLQTLHAPRDSSGYESRGGPAFGRTLDLDGDRLVVGALRDKPPRVMRELSTSTADPEGSQGLRL